MFALALGCGKKDKPITTGLEGGWTLVSIEHRGEKMTPSADLPAAERRFQATTDKLVSSKGGKEETITYKLDTSKTPNEIDLTQTKGNGKTETLYGIFNLEGDTLTICAVPSNDPAKRPKEFTTTDDNGAMIMTLKKD